MRRSRYCSRRTAAEALEELVSRVRGRHVLVSYSTDGLVPHAELAAMLSPLGRLSCFVERYVRYRVSSQRPSPRPHNVEFVIAVDTTARGGRGNATRVVEQIDRELDTLREVTYA
jgi:adenine-specific DNA-methyltransferase